ncbi:DNA cytosine methyltransferase [Staphylococcus arlettae]
MGFIGGPPCPDFSIAGKNKGAEGENGRLSTTYFDFMICQIKLE